MTLLDLKPNTTVFIYDREYVVGTNTLIDGKLHTSLISTNSPKCWCESDMPITETLRGYEIRIAPV